MISKPKGKRHDNPRTAGKYGTGIDCCDTGRSFVFDLLFFAYVFIEAPLVARIFGCLLFLVWLSFIPHSRRFLRQRGSIAHATVFQYNILPFIVSVGLIVTGDLWMLFVLPVAWVLSLIFAVSISFFSFIFPFGLGGGIGIQIFSGIFPQSNGWYWGGYVIGGIAMIIFCSIITTIVTTPTSWLILPRPRRKAPGSPGLLETKDNPIKNIVKAVLMSLRQQNIHIAAENDDLADVERLLQKGIAVDARDKFGLTPLMCAANKGHLDVVKYLVSKDADVNARSKEDATPLYWAASEGHLDIIKFLVDKGADVNAKTESDWTPLMPAVVKGHLEVIKFLVENGADVNARTKIAVTPLMQAMINGQLNIVKVLVDKGADMNAEDDIGLTPLMVAASNGHPDVVRFLVAKGANMNAKDNNGATALMWAKHKSKQDVVEFLKQQGAKE